MEKNLNSGLGSGTSGAGQISTEQQEYGNAIKHVDMNLMKEKSKSKAVKNVTKLPSKIQDSVKKFFKGGSNKYSSFTVDYEDNKYIVKMIKPGNVPGSKAIYVKEIDSSGKTLKVYKDTYDPQGKLVHRKDK